MDFITGVPRIFQGLDTIWVVVDRLIKSAYFLPIQYPMDKLAQIYLQEIVRLHGVPETIVSNWNPQFQSRFWKSLSVALGRKSSTAAHSQTGGQSK